jgi:hypothetical protein
VSHERWIIVLSALVLLQSGIIVKQARTIAKADATSSRPGRTIRLTNAISMN